MGIVAVIVNSALIGLSGQASRMNPDLDTESTFILIVSLEVRRTASYSLFSVIIYTG